VLGLPVARQAHGEVLSFFAKAQGVPLEPKLVKPRPVPRELVPTAPTAPKPTDRKPPSARRQPTMGKREAQALMEEAAREAEGQEVFPQSLHKSLYFLRCRFAGCRASSFRGGSCVPKAPAFRVRRSSERTRRRRLPRRRSAPPRPHGCIPTCFRHRSGHLSCWSGRQATIGFTTWREQPAHLSRFTPQQARLPASDWLSSALNPLVLQI